MAGVSVAICATVAIENRNLQTSLLIVANRPDLGSVNKIFSSRSNTLLWLRSLGELRVSEKFAKHS